MTAYITMTMMFQAIFLLAYDILLKKETFFTYNRIYLILAPLIGLALPFLEIPLLQQNISSMGFVSLPEIIIGAESNSAIGQPEGTEEAFLLFDMWWIIYGLGVLGSLCIFTYKITKLRALVNSGKPSRIKGFPVIEIPGSTEACTFFNTILLGEDLTPQERQQILLHEAVHVRHRHTWDLLFFEFLRMSMWFNPLVYLFQRRVGVLHEFIADAGVVQQVKKQTYYEQLLNLSFDTRNITFINQFFNHSIIKKRIVMLQKSKSKSTAKGKYLVLIPLIACMLTSVACTQDETMATPNLPEEVVTVNVKDLDKMTTAEKALVETAMAQVTQEGKYQTLIVTDGDETLELSVNATPRATVAVQKKDLRADQKIDVPFAVIEEVPVFPGCNVLASNKDRKECMSGKISEFVSANFNTALGKELGLTGINRIYVQFRINREGIVEVLGVRAPHPALKAEAERVVNALPVMKPGKQRGQEVGVLYSLPIVFQVDK